MAANDSQRQFRITPSPVAKVAPESAGALEMLGCCCCGGAAWAFWGADTLEPPKPNEAAVAEAERIHEEVLGRP